MKPQSASMLNMAKRGERLTARLLQAKRAFT